MSVLAFILGFIAFVWVFGNLGGYFATMPGAHRDGVRWPFNYRIFLGPSAYIDWAYDQPERQ